MKLTRLRVGEEASQRLSLLKGRTGLTPNILCRIGFCLSLNDPTVPGAILGPSNTIFVTTPAGIYTVVTAITDQPMDQQYPLSLAVLAMWTAKATG